MVEIGTLHVQADTLIEEKNIAQQIADETVKEYTDVLEETLVLRKVTCFLYLLLLLWMCLYIIILFFFLFGNLFARIFIFFICFHYLLHLFLFIIIIPGMRG